MVIVVEAVKARKEIKALPPQVRIENQKGLLKKETFFH